ncbi:MAG: ester cyclase [Candidatus Binatia bacterium]
MLRKKYRRRAFLKSVGLTAVGAAASSGFSAFAAAEENAVKETAHESIAGMEPVVELVLTFWNEVWNPPYDINKIDELMVEDFVLTSAGRDIVSRAAFKEWVRTFQAKLHELRLYPQETFANKGGTRVVSRWRATGKNNGMLGTKPDNRLVEFTGIAIWEIRGGRLAHNWVERSAWELYQQLTAEK